MCRSIKTLRGSDPPATPMDSQAAALQYVRKISGYRVPSQLNAEAFGVAVAEIAATTDRLLAALPSTPRPVPSPERADTRRRPARARE